MCPVPIVTGTNWNASCHPVALRAAEASRLLLAHLIALPAQAQIAAVATEESAPGELGFDFPQERLHYI